MDGLRTVGALAALACLALPATAWGWARNFTVVQNTSASNSLAAKSVTANCPAGAGAVGTGGLVSPALSNLGISQLGGGTASTLRASEADSVSGSWSASVRAFCLAQQSFAPAAGTAASFVKGIEVVESQTVANSTAAKSATAQCPAGKTAITGGGSLGNGSQDLAFSSLQRIEGGTAWRVNGHEVDDVSTGWQLRARAVCANISTETQTSDYVNANGAQRRGFSSSSGASPRKTLTVTCDAPRRALGGFAQVTNSTQTGPGPNGVVLTRSEPTSEGLGWSVEARETDPTDQGWRLAIDTLCVSLTGPPA